MDTIRRRFGVLRLALVRALQPASGLALALWLCLSVSLWPGRAAAQVPAPQVADGQPVDWWFVFKFNAKSFPGCPIGEDTTCPFGGEPSTAKLGQTFAFASADDPSLTLGSTCIGSTSADPVGATFADLYRNQFFYVVWNDQFYQDPKLTGCGDACASPWGHSKGVLAWDANGDGFVMQVTTPSWPGSGSQTAARQAAGNTLGCIARPNNVLVSQGFFASRLKNGDVLQVLAALANASVATDPTNPQIANIGGPSDIQAAARRLGKKSKSTKVVRVMLSNGVGLMSKPSGLHVPPWQLVSSQLGRVSLRVASWWAYPKIDSTAANTPVECWDASLPKPGAVEIATTGHWDGINFGLKGGPGPDYNHAKLAVTTSGTNHLVIFGDMNQQGALTDSNCGRSQNGRGGLFFIVENEGLWKSVSSLIDGQSAPLAGQ